MFSHVPCLWKSFRVSRLYGDLLKCPWLGKEMSFAGDRSETRLLAAIVASVFSVGSLYHDLFHFVQSIC